MAVSIGPKIGIDGEAEYRKQLINIINQTKTLDKEMKNLDSTFNEATEGMSKHEKELELATEKSKKLDEAVQKMRDAVEQSTEKNGEHADQTEKWKQKLADAEAELKKANDAVKELSSPMGELSSAISDQETQLETLKSQYADAYVEFGATSEECQRLAEDIGRVSGELAENKGLMEEASSAASDLANGGMQEVSSQSDVLAGAGDSIVRGLGGSFGTIASSIVSGGGILEGINFVVDAIGQAITLAGEFQEAMDEAQDNIVIATGAMGDELDSLRDSAKEAWLAIAGDTGVDEIGTVVGAVNTRFGELGDAATTAATQFGQYTATMGESASKAVNDVADVMQQWGLMTDDANANNEVAVGILDKLTTASQLADVSGGELCDILVRQKSAFSELGMSMDDALGFMIQYRDAGGSVSDVGTSMQTMMSKLKGTTDDMGAAWQSATDIMSSSADLQTILQSEIGNTGVTIEEAFGTRRAQQLISTFQAMDGSATEWTGKIQGSSGAMTEAAANTIEFKDAMEYLNKQMLYGNQEQKQSAAEVYQLFADQIDGYEDMIVKYVQSEVRKNGEAVRSSETMSKGVSDATSKAGTAYRNMASAANDAINSIPEYKTFRLYTEASSVVMQTDAKGNVTPTKGTTYKFARGYSTAMLVNNPTIFGVSGGQALMAGDKVGAEVVVGEAHLLNMMTSAVRQAFGYVPSGGSTTNNNNSVNVNVYGAPGQDVKELADLVSKQINKQVNIRRST